MNYQQFLEIAQSDDLTALRTALAALTTRAQTAALLTQLYQAFGIIQYIPGVLFAPAGFSFEVDEAPEFAALFPVTNRPPLSPWTPQQPPLWNPQLPTIWTACLVPVNVLWAVNAAQAWMGSQS